MYNTDCLELFDEALQQAKQNKQFIDALSDKHKKTFSTDQYYLLLAIDNTQLLFQIHGPVFAIAALQHIKNHFEQALLDKINFELVAEKLQCPKIYRHQIEWVVHCYNQFISNMI